MTLMEILIVLIIASILSTVGVISYRRSLVNAWERDARAMLKLIKNAEAVYMSEMNTYIGCNDNDECSADLRLHLPAAGGIWSYSVNLRGTESFCAQAIPADAYADLHTMSIVGHRSDPGQDMEEPVHAGCN